MKFKKFQLLFIFSFIVNALVAQQFVGQANGHFIFNDKPYYYVGANYWFGGLLSNSKAGKERVKKELDFLVTKGVTNLRIMAGAEGSGQINGVPRVEPALQPEAEKFNGNLLNGLDYLLSEMGKRNMKAVIFISNNWEWSGGFLQYLNWNGKIADSILKRKLSWDEMRDYVSLFYSCDACGRQYSKQLSFIISRKNSITKKKYADDPTIMAWEIANEPRPMRPAAITAYRKWLSLTAAEIKKIDKHHLVTVGSEGEMGSETLEVFEAIHSDKNIDYATIHIWPKNWGWFKDTSIAKELGKITGNTISYIDKHIAVAKHINKPLVIEEFGLPRDMQSFVPGTPTNSRDIYYEIILKELLASFQTHDVISGINFWSFSGSGRPSGKQLLWKKGDDLLGDPPVEEQGLNSVFDNDISTWKIIESYSQKINAAHGAVFTK